ncbi:DpnII family type II restriction endonuclease [Spiroplasma endosymbiont of Nebria brevicollis]|uniref:DpnII family type II restriction endonuclease n=1 Tax=Spiroplasma endosymbiont of Nebria brevicollis TaxID=3066284 RepID=UPI00313E00CD
MILLFSNKSNNLVDYVTGITVGLDSHARKNRTGFIMEKIVENFIKKTNYVEFFNKIKKIDIANKYGIAIDKLLVDKNNKEAEKNLILLLKQKNVYF